MTTSISGTGGVTFNDASVQNTAATEFGFKNRIINGAQIVDQRNSAGSAVTVNSVTKAYATDRFCGTGIGSAGVFTLGQVTTAPSNFINSLKATVTTADASLAATDLYRVMHLIEGLNCADLGWGTATAQTVTLSFWVYSNLTGTFGGSLTNSAVNRSYPFTFTISVANTWEQKTITVAGDTSGTWLTTSGIGIAINFGLGVGSTYSGTASAWASAEYYSATGSTNVMATLSNTFYITGVQLEKSSTATSFDYRPYGTELLLAQRYFAKISASAIYSGFGNGLFTGAPTGSFISKLPVTFRSGPTVSILNLAAYDGVSIIPITALGTTYTGTDFVYQDFSVASGGTVSRPISVIANATTDAFLAFSAEL